jgi:hypothetical protein
MTPSLGPGTSPQHDAQASPQNGPQGKPHAARGLNLKTLRLIFAAEPELGEAEVLAQTRTAPEAVAAAGEEILEILAHQAPSRRRDATESPVTRVYACMLRHHQGTVGSLVERMERLQADFGLKTQLAHFACHTAGKGAWFWMGAPLLLASAFLLLVTILGCVLAWLVPSADPRAFWHLLPQILWTTLLPTGLAIAFTFTFEGIVRHAGLGRTSIRIRVAAFLCGWREARQAHGPWTRMVRNTFFSLPGDVDKTPGQRP